MTKGELIKILERYPDHTRITIEFAPGSGNYSETVQWGDGCFRGGDLICADEHKEEKYDWEFNTNAVALYPYTPYDDR